MNSRLYLTALEDELGVAEGALPGVSETALLESFGKAMKQRSREYPCFGAQVMSSEEWWADVVRSTFRGAGVQDHELDPVFDKVFDKLFHHVFAGESAWELVPVSVLGRGCVAQSLVVVADLSGTVSGEIASACPELETCFQGLMRGVILRESRRERPTIFPSSRLFQQHASKRSTRLGS